MMTGLIIAPQRAGVMVRGGRMILRIGSLTYQEMITIRGW